jgi:hypothetical protein
MPSVTAVLIASITAVPIAVPFSTIAPYYASKPCIKPASIF